MTLEGSPRSPFRRTSRKLLGYGLPVVLLASAVSILLWPGGDAGPTPPTSSADPTRFGPERTLELTQCAWEPGSKNTSGVLRIRGTTNFPVGSSIRLDVRSRGRSLVTYPVVVGPAGIALDSAGQGHVMAGSYEVVATFSLEEQSPRIQEALHYQPRRLVARRALVLPVSSGETALQARLRTLFGAVNAQPRDKQALARLDREALTLSRELWIADQKVALKKLRLAIEQAGRPRFERERFERLLIEAHVLAGL